MKSLKSIGPHDILRSIYNGIIAINSEGIIIYINEAAERIFNVCNSLNKHAIDGLPYVGEKLLECLRTGNEFRAKKITVQTTTLAANINPIVRARKVIGAIGVVQDISEIDDMSKELDLSKNMKSWLDTIIDCAYDGLWICDHEGNVVKISKSWEKLSHVKDIRAEFLIGKNVRELIEMGLFKESVTLEVLKQKAAVTMIQDSSNGRKVLSTGNPIFGEKGQISYVVTNIRDITELDHLRNRLRETEALARGYKTKLSELEMKGVDLSTIAFRSEKMHRIIEMALRIAKVNSTVLVQGESGVGKGMIAKLIHKNSERASGPFIRVDCAGIPESLFESELFGYEKGAFTGAKTEGKPGFFELADKGTLFLDEVAEISLSSQSKLLRFLEDHEIVRIGGTTPKTIDVRVIAATNKNIEEMVGSKLFRKDLFYRLNVVPILIPPLRERRDDILPILYHYLNKLNGAYSKRKTLSTEVIDLFCEYDFPGNIREMSNLVERLVVSAQEDRIEVHNLPEALTGPAARVVSPQSHSNTISLKDALKRHEKVIIEEALKKYRSQQEIAKVLKVDRATISRKVKKYFGSSCAIVHE